MSSDDATLNPEGATGIDAPEIGHTTETQATALGLAEDTTTAGDTANDAAITDRPKSAREEAIDAITANRLREFAKETGVAVDVDAAAAVDTAPADRKLKVKLDGEELELDESEVIRGYQKDQTASRRLEQAAAEHKRLQEERALLNTERAAFEATRAMSATAAAPAGDDDTTNSQATPFDEDGAKQIYEALVSGDETEAVEAIKKLTQGRPAEAIPSTKIAAQVRQQIAWDAAQEGFAKDFKDITADPLLRQIASNTLTETLKTSASYEQAFREAGERTRAWVRSAGGVGPQAEGGNTPTDPGLAEKQLRKERIDNPTAISARAGGKPKEQAETPSDVVKGMRAARGLPA